MLPWPEMWRAALRAGVPANYFWCLSLREWLWLCTRTSVGMRAEELARLISLYPDNQYTDK